MIRNISSPDRSGLDRASIRGYSYKVTEIHPMSENITLVWEDDYAQPVRIYWEDDGSSSEVEFFLHNGLLMMRSQYSNELGILVSNWCLGYFNTMENAIPYANFVVNTYKKHSNLAECPAVVYVDWEGSDAYDLAGNLITKEYFIR